VIMVHKLANAGPQRIFTEENHLLQAAFLNVPYIAAGYHARRSALLSR